jgi:hypothetical protein
MRPRIFLIDSHYLNIQGDASMTSWPILATARPNPSRAARPLPYWPPHFVRRRPLMKQSGLQENDVAADG